MKLVKRILIVLTTTLVFTSCIEVKEKVTYNEKGGGTNLTIINFKSFGTMFKSNRPYLDILVGSKNGDMYDLFETSCIDIVNELSTIKGISNTSVVYVDSLNIGFKFDFEDAQALNNTMEILSKSAGHKETMAKFTYKQEKKFERKDNDNIFESTNDVINQVESIMLKAIKGYNSAEVDSVMSKNGIDMEELRKSLTNQLDSIQNIVYVYEYTFPYEVKKAKSKYKTEIVNNNTVVQTIKFRQEENKGKNSSLKITFK